MSRRNNSQRLGAQKDENAPAATGQGFDFSFVSPSSFVELPSEGRFYPESHPLHGQSTIEVREMTAKEEDILADFNLQKQGIAVDRMVQSVIVDKRISVNSLLVGDKNAITIAARIGGYGAKYKTEVTCPACNTKNSFEFNLAELEAKTAEESPEVQHVQDRVFQLELPRTQYKIRIRLLTSAEMAKFSKPLRNAAKGKSNANLQTNLLKLMLDSAQNPADGEWFKDREVLNKLAEQLPALDSIYIRSAYKVLAPDIDMTQDFECSNCGHEQEMEVPLDAGFFWPDR